MTATHICLCWRLMFQLQDSTVAGCSNLAPTDPLTFLKIRFLLTRTICLQDDYFGWMRAVEDQVAALGIDISQYRHRSLLLPPLMSTFMGSNGSCSWTGQATKGPYNGDSTMMYGPGKYGYSWISGDTYTQPAAWLHEVGSNPFQHFPNKFKCCCCSNHR